MFPLKQTKTDLTKKSETSCSAFNTTDMNTSTDKVCKTDEKPTNLSHTKRGNRLNSFKTINLDTSNTQFNVFKEDIDAEIAS